MTTLMKPVAAFAMAAAFLMVSAMAQSDGQTYARSAGTQATESAGRDAPGVDWRAEDQDWWEDSVRDTIEVYGPVGSYEHAIAPSREKVAAKAPEQRRETVPEAKAEAREAAKESKRLQLGLVEPGTRQQPPAKEPPRKEAKRQDKDRDSMVVGQADRMNGQEWDRD